ncbi:putative 2-ketoarginine decarboxylase AruI [Sulfitobacter pontiacus]|uniref:2-ketoarginine decarboxylase AruI n=1 Tax=Sulfitobacter pontiacus TaxID=60137 RepID=A0AAX3AFF2_9RHOB|nr:5-guanidino-2-oxopentanoate decarboxylase [Sulfitobacter pontiacus]UOA23915.1 putative 2-ketoarginine decarboxylase AruI [Sulfitobacter pontiacus]
MSAVQTRPLGAQISHMLKSRGVEVIFGIPGVHNQEMYRGIEEAGLTHVLARHEQGAGFMADGYARATGKPGVAYVITGPGLCNVMTPMGQAYSDSVPVLVLSSCLDETAARKGQLHQMNDQRAAAETVCDWSEMALTAPAAYQLIDRALTEFATSRPRSKHISVPIHLLEAEAAPAHALAVSATLPAVPSAQIDLLAQKLAAAQKPLFIFGGGAVGIQNVDALLARWQAASLTTYAGRGIVSPGAPLHFGAYLARESSVDVIAQADLVIAVGTELAEVDLWRDNLGHSGELVRVDIDPPVLADPQAAPFAILGDAVQVMAALDAALPDERTAAGWNAVEVAGWRKRWRSEVDMERPGILAVVEAVKAATPEGTMIYSDMTQFAYAATEVWEMDRPGYWHHPYGFGTLGYATPAAIGGAIGRPGLPTMAIIGDYGFQYTVQELGAAVELGLPLPIILWDNGKLGEIEDSMTRAQIAPNAVIAHNPDFCKLAEAYGAYAAAPKSLEELPEVLAQAFKADRPTLIYLTPQTAV